MKWFSHHHNSPSLAQSLPDENNNSAATIRKVVKIGCFVNALLMALKLCAGYLGHSDALVADGFHSLNDLAADIIMLVFVGISYRQPDDKYSYGYGKFETFSSFLISSVLVVVAFFIVREAIESLVAYFHGEVLPQPDIWTFIVVLFAMACKEGLFRFYSSAGRKAGSKALKANAWHHRSDAMASIATLIGVTFSHFFGEGFRVLDPIASLVIAIFIIIPAIRILKPSFAELMERSLPSAERQKAMELVEKIPEVKGIEYLRARRNGHKYIFDFGIKTDASLNVAQCAQLTSVIKSVLTDAFCPHVILSVNYNA